MAMVAAAAALAEEPRDGEVEVEMMEDSLF